MDFWPDCNIQPEIEPLGICSENGEPSAYRFPVRRPQNLLAERAYFCLRYHGELLRGHFTSSVVARR